MTAAHLTNKVVFACTQLGALVEDVKEKRSMDKRRELKEIDR